MSDALGVFIVQPSSGPGWTLFDAQSGEVLNFESGGQAERRAMAMAQRAYALNGSGEVWVYDRLDRLVGRWSVVSGSLALKAESEPAQAA